MLTLYLLVLSAVNSLNPDLANKMSDMVKILESATCKCLHQELINLGIQKNSVDPNYVGPYAVPNCLQRFSADGTRMQRVNVILLYIKKERH